MKLPEWLRVHRLEKYDHDSRPVYKFPPQGMVRDRYYQDNASNNHDRNDGLHVSPYDNGWVRVGPEGLQVNLIQGIDEEQFRKTIRRTIRATSGIAPDADLSLDDPEEMLKGGLQTALESQVVVFEVIGASRVLTHQLVRSRRAAFHQQSQRATWYGDRPDFRLPLSVFNAGREGDGVIDPTTNIEVLEAYEEALMAAWKAYRLATDAGVSYQDARYILPEGTVNYILCEYPLREFINMFAYRGCSMFQWEMVHIARSMRRVLVEAHPFLEPYVKISCEKGKTCFSCNGTGRWSRFNKAHETDPSVKWVDGIIEGSDCPFCEGNGGTFKCTFQGWENPENGCDFPWAKQSNRTFLPDPRSRIG